MIRPIDLPEAPATSEPRPVSAALSSNLPDRVWIADEHDRSARVTPAGYELFFDTSYRLCVVGPVTDMHVEVDRTTLLRCQQVDISTFHKHGERRHYVPIRVGPKGLFDKLSHYKVYSEQIRLRLTMEDGTRCEIVIPMILRMRLWWVAFLVTTMVALVSTVYEVLWDVFQGAIWNPSALSALFTLTPWIRGGVLALLALLCGWTYRYWSIWRRALELRRSYAERWRRPLSK